MPKNKKQKTATFSLGKEEDGPLFRAPTKAKGGGKQTILLESHPNLLSDLLSPALTSTEFLTQFFRRQAVHVPSTQGAARVEKVRKQMMDLRVKQLFEETASENIYVWLQPQQEDSGHSCTQAKEAKEKKINSIEVPDAEMAYALYQAGHPTYCRAPPQVEELLLAALLENTGLGCGQYDTSGQSMTSLGRAEVETFISTTTGSITGWHTDFQENFTIQLSGRKKWSLQRGTVEHVLRGVTPHYAVSAIEGQIKAGRLDQKEFAFGPPTIGRNATGPIDEVILEPGDVLYFPAGMWHRIEVLEPGISINCSLMATNYATLVCQSLQHILLQRSEWRACVCRPTDGSSITNQLDQLLQGLPMIIEEWKNQGGAAQGIIPPVLRHGEIRDPEDSDEELWEEMEDDEQRSSVEGENESTSGNREIETSSNKPQSDTEEDDDPIVSLYEDPPETADFDPSPSVLQQKYETHEIVRNPLALLLDEKDILRHYKANGKASEDYIYILNVNYAGNEAHESHLRIRLLCNEAKLDKMKTNDLVEHFLKKKTSVIAWLLYLGYLVWVPRKA